MTMPAIAAPFADAFGVTITASTPVTEVDRSQPSPSLVALAGANHFLAKRHDAPQTLHVCEGRHVVIEGHTHALCYYADGRVDVFRKPVTDSEEKPATITETAVADIEDVFDAVRAEVGDKPDTVFYPALLYRLAQLARGKKAKALELFRDAVQVDSKIAKFKFLFERKLDKGEYQIDEAASKDEAVDEAMTPGLMKRITPEVSRTACGTCGFAVPVYPGRYPKSCPNCEAELDYGGPVDEAVLEDASVSRTIWDQLGGNKFAAMTGAKPALSLKDGIELKLGRNGKNVTHVRITLEGDDTYTMLFRTVRGTATPKIKAEVKGVYADALRKTFEEHTGLHTSLGTMKHKNESQEHSMKPSHAAAALRRWAEKNGMDAMIAQPSLIEAVQRAPSLRALATTVAGIVEGDLEKVLQRIESTVGPGAVDDPDYAGVSDGDEEIITDEDAEAYLDELLGDEEDAELAEAAEPVYEAVRKITVKGTVESAALNELLGDYGANANKKGDHWEVVLSGRYDKAREGHAKTENQELVAKLKKLKGVTSVNESEVDEVRASHPSVVAFKKGQRVSWTAPDKTKQTGAVVSDVAEAHAIKVTPDGGKQDVLVKRADLKVIKEDAVEEGLPGKATEVLIRKALAALNQDDASDAKKNLEAALKTVTVKRVMLKEDESAIAALVTAGALTEGALNEFVQYACNNSVTAYGTKTPTTPGGYTSVAFDDYGDVRILVRPDDFFATAPSQHVAGYLLGKAVKQAMADGALDSFLDTVFDLVASQDQALAALDTTLVESAGQVDEAISKKVNLLHDGKVVLRNADEEAVLKYIHKKHSYSLAHALAYEGYSIEPVGADAKEGTDESATPGTDALKNVLKKKIALKDTATQALVKALKNKALVKVKESVVEFPRSMLDEMQVILEALELDAAAPVEIAGDTIRITMSEDVTAALEHHLAA